MAHDWVKSPKKWIDPAKESTADKTALQSGQKTYQEICAERGKDWRQAIDETAEVLDRVLTLTRILLMGLNIVLDV